MKVFKYSVLIFIIFLLLSMNFVLEGKNALTRYERLFILETVYASVEDREKFSGIISKVENSLYNSYFIKLPVKVQDYRYARTLFRRKNYSKIFPLETHAIELSKKHLKLKRRLIHQYRKYPEFRINEFTSFNNEKVLTEISRHAIQLKLFKVRLYFNLTDKIINIQFYKLKRYRRSSIVDMFKKEKNWLPFYEFGNIDIQKRKFIEIEQNLNQTLDVKLEKAWETKNNLVDTWAALSTIFFEGGLEEKDKSEMEFEDKTNSLVLEIKKIIVQASFR